MTHTHRPARLLLFAAAGLAVLTTATACSASKSTAAAPGPSGSPAANGGTANGGGQQAPPGTFGIAADVTPGRIEVQDPTTGQTTVTYTAKTAFTQQKTVTDAAVTPGECVSAVDTTRLGGRTSGSPTAPRPSTASGTPISITAATITITQPLSGSCTPAAGRRGGFGRPSGRPTTRPSNFPTGSPTAGAGARSGFGGFVSGKVTSVSGTTIDVQAVDRQTAQAMDDTVTVTPSTRYVATMAATSSAVKGGVCVQATGPSDSTGAVAATRIGISDAVNGSCTTGFGGRGGFGRTRGGESTATGG